MKRLLLLCAAALCCLQMAAVSVRGRVSCDGAGIAGVCVSDGTRIVLTARDGSYKMNTPLELGYVFISVPSGYEAPVEGVIPQFFQRLDPSEKKVVVDFTLKKVDQAKCNLIVYNDIHLTGDPVYHDLDQVSRGFLADVREHAPSLGNKPLYGLTLGDMTTDSRWYKRNFALPEYLQQVGDFPFPIYHAMGNHDNDIKGGSDLAACKAYRDVIGPHYYSVNIGAFHVVVLDDIVYDMPLGQNGQVVKSNGYKTYVEEAQLEWLKKDIRTIQPTTPVILALHAPLYRIKGMTGGKLDVSGGFNGGHSPEEVLDILGYDRKVYILSGHTHMNYYVDVNANTLEHNCVAVAGSSWYTESACGRNLSSDGLPGGYAVYTIDGESLSWYFKPSGIPVEEGQFRAYDINGVPEEFAEGLDENTVLVNVFNYDPQWKVSVFENGRPLEVKHVWVWDPLYAAGVKGFSFSKKGAFRPHRNSHMFAARASAPDTPVEIVVTDRFGRVYRQVFTRPSSFGRSQQ